MAAELSTQEAAKTIAMAMYASVLLMMLRFYVVATSVYRPRPDTYCMSRSSLFLSGPVVLPGGNVSMAVQVFENGPKPLHMLWDVSPTMGTTRLGPGEPDQLPMDPPSEVYDVAGTMWYAGSYFRSGSVSVPVVHSHVLQSGYASTHALSLPEGSLGAVVHRLAMADDGMSMVAVGNHLQRNDRMAVVVWWLRIGTQLIEDGREEMPDS